MSKWYNRKKYSTQHYIQNDRSAKATWWIHTVLEDKVLLNGLLKDEGKVCDLYSETDEYELMHNVGSWTSGEFPFDMMLVHHRKDPRKYCRDGYNSFYVQFREDFELAQVAPVDSFVKTYKGFEAPAFKTWTVQINPMAYMIGKFFYESFAEAEKHKKVAPKANAKC